MNAHIRCFHVLRPLSSIISPIKTSLSNCPFQDPLSLLRKCKQRSQLSQIQAQMVATGLINNPSAVSKLLTFLCSHPLPSHLDIAYSVAHYVNHQYSYTWNTIIKAYLQMDNPNKALLVYVHVRRKGLRIDSYTLLYVVRACGLVLSDLDGEIIHAQIFKMGFESEVILQTALVQMYGLFGKLACAKKVFDETPQRDLIMWNALVSAYEQQHQPSEALSIVREMTSGSVRPNRVTVVSILSACSALFALKEGKEVHAFAVKSIVDLDVVVCNALINMYANCRHLIDSRRVFETTPCRNAVTWTCMINGYSNNYCLHEALALFAQMQSANVKPDEITLLVVVSMCSNSGSTELAEWVDRYVNKNRYGERTGVANALMDMHSKCGNLKRACQVFDNISVKTLISWTTMIQGLAMHGHGIAALIRFSQMQREGFEPDYVVFLSVLSACSHAGLVDEGRRCFELMVEEHGLEPWKEHYGCMVDLLCRAGLVDEAFEFVRRMPMKPDGVTWRTLLGACGSLGKIDLAMQVMNCLRELEPSYSGNFVLMANLYASVGAWDNVEEVRDEMEVQEVVKRDPAFSSVEVDLSVR